MSVYIVANIAIENRDEYTKYERGFPEIFARYQGELLAVSDSPVVIEGEWPYTRAAIIRFPSEAEARRWYESPEYQAIAEHRRRGSRGAIIGLAGL